MESIRSIIYVGILKYKTSLIQHVTQCKKKILLKNDKITNHVVEGTEEELKECWRNEVGTGKQVT
jgi:hypothetical protein